MKMFYLDLSSIASSKEREIIHTHVCERAEETWAKPGNMLIQVAWSKTESFEDIFPDYVKYVMPYR